MHCTYKVTKSELIDVRKFFEEYKANLEAAGYTSPRSDNEIAKSLGYADYSDEKFQKLLKSISLDHLNQDDETPMPSFDYQPGVNNNFIRHIPIVPVKGLNLKTVVEMMKYKNNNEGSGDRSLFGLSALSYKSINNSILKEAAESDYDLEPYSDVLISIRFYRPFRFRSGVQSCGPKFSEEFYVLGSQSLSELKDRISCWHNNKRLIDISEDPHQQLPTVDRNSGFFFITDTFYNDMRNPENCDYSEVIRKWSKTNHEKYFDTPTPILNNVAKMEDTKFIDLKVHLGFPQVYQHEGICEHVFTFSSIRLLGPQDYLKRENYPLLNSIAFPNAKLCHICAGREYTFIVKNSKRQFHDPCYLCRACFESFYYIQGKKIGDFQAYRLDPNDNDSNTTDDETEFSFDSTENGDDDE